MKQSNRVLYFTNVYPYDLIGRLLFGKAESRQIKLESADPVTRDIEHNYLDAVECARFRNTSKCMAYFKQYTGALGPHIGPMVDTIKGPYNNVLNIFARRELVIDIDLTDYKTRSYFCACKDTLCTQCWLLIEVGAALFQVICTERYQLGPMLCVFSGGKGCHFWWGSSQVYTLLPIQLKMLHDTLNNAPSFTTLSTQPDALLRILFKTWETRGIKHRALLGSLSLEDNKLAMFFKDKLPRHIKETFTWPAVDGTPEVRSLTRWRHYLNVMGKQNFSLVMKALCDLLWPCIDQKVLTDPAHLIKAPFTIHKSTKKPSLPLANVNECIPERMPNIDTLCANSDMYQDMCNLGRVTFRTWLDTCGYKL